MNPILKWLHKNENMVHVTVMFLFFYGIPTVSLSLIYPGLVEPLARSALVGLTLTVLLFVSYRAATYVTDVIKSAVAQAALEQMRDTSALIKSVKNDAIIDYTSPNTLVIDAPKSEKKKRGPRPKSVKKEG